VEVLNNMDCSPNIIQVIKLRMRWAGDVACMGKRRGAHRVLVEKPEGKRQLGRQGHRWEDNIKIDLQEVGWKVWIDLVHDRYRWQALVNAVMNLQVPQNVGNFWTS
jgi:hypothetical protein